MSDSATLVDPLLLLVDSDDGPGESVLLRVPDSGDSLAIHRLIKSSPPLDLNSVYTYLLLSEHFPGTCVVAESAGCVVGFVSAYRPPRRPGVLFVWQVAVHKAMRGAGLGGRMLRHLLERRESASIQYIETTVSPDNPGSRRMFAEVARRLCAPVHETPLFDRRLFGPQDHADEPLLRIGPFGAL